MLHKRKLAAPLAPEAFCTLKLNLEAGLVPGSSNRINTKLVGAAGPVRRGRKHPVPAAANATSASSKLVVDGIAGRLSDSPPIRCLKSCGGWNDQSGRRTKSPVGIGTVPGIRLHSLLVPDIGPTRFHAMFAVGVKWLGAVMIVQGPACRSQRIGRDDCVHRLSHSVLADDAGSTSGPRRPHVVDPVVATETGTACIAARVAGAAPAILRHQRSAWQAQNSNCEG